MSSKRAIIFGISGQDGSLLAEFLLGKGYRVIGQTRSLKNSNFINLKTLNILDFVEMVEITEFDVAKLAQFLERIEPTEIYNLSGQSSVSLSFKLPNETLISQLNFVNLLLEAMHKIDCNAKLFNAGSGECFGDTSGRIATETSRFSPMNPYAVAKCGAFWTVSNYRNYYGVNASTGILFNHESSLRPLSFVTRKIIKAAIHISQGSREKLYLGNLSVKRDWGLASEYIVAMWEMLQQDKPDDYIISTGVARSLEEFVEIAFRVLNLDWCEHVITDSSLCRPSDSPMNHGDPSKAKVKFDWSSTNALEDVVTHLVTAELNPTL
ncbi:GDP-mannose 4,6-dehydratase [Haliea sp. AH-315-K21]|uniref:GDP-mannose 4,6-dehydratase n=1 Tax=SAR86 cluster bacterium TaxID=2030880 RepID=A0A2A5C956_9GAMM|nr:GDP-mannose 4,6-dehydratase [Haliea sp. AH-315-K21]MBN4075780.1 GDP-mannose 4,6-dehydratase [Gammaproteobacteria bacterium AH-315-E17]PCJ40424.1 MAG: GDP-mannose 4,6-dehydratase [SAR86 cluster bacterium]